MIKSLSELLRRVQAIEAERLGQHRIKHGPTIGSMYEGLTKSLVDKVMPLEHSIRVVDGFIEGLDRRLSPQADILVVHGEGERIPHTNSYIYRVQQVIAVFEIKKRLDGSRLNDAVVKMAKVVDLFRATLQEDGNEVDFRPALRAFAQTTGHWPMSDDDAAELGGLGAVFEAFKLEQMAPLRIIWGYEGYKSEHALRAGFLTQMKCSLDKSSYGLYQLPSLVVSGENSLVKMVGQPYSSRLVEGWWHILTSTTENPVRILLELLWTKISAVFGRGFPMDDTLVMERLAAFLALRYREDQSGTLHLEYQDFKTSKAALKALAAPQWSPNDLTDFQTVLMLGAVNGLDVTEDRLRRYAAENGIDLLTEVRALVESRQLAWTSSTTLKPISPSLIAAFSPDGSISMSTNPDLFRLWAEQRFN